MVFVQVEDQVGRTDNALSYQCDPVSICLMVVGDDEINGPGSPAKELVQFKEGLVKEGKEIQINVPND